MIDTGVFVTTQAMRRQLRAMPCEFYLVRLIHHATGRAFPGERVWTAQQALSLPPCASCVSVIGRDAMFTCSPLPENAPAMQMRRMTRLTNGFSKKWENLKAAYAVHFAYYNFCRVHSTLKNTPAMAAGMTNHVWEIDELLLAGD